MVVVVWWCALLSDVARIDRVDGIMNFQININLKHIWVDMEVDPTTTMWWQLIKGANCFFLIMADLENYFSLHKLRHLKNDFCFSSRYLWFIFFVFFVFLFWLSEALKCDKQANIINPWGMWTSSLLWSSLSNNRLTPIFTFRDSDDQHQHFPKHRQKCTDKENKHIH